MKFKKDALEKPENLEKKFSTKTIDQLISEIEDTDTEQKPPQETEGLVPSRYFDGGLSPLLDHYLPEGLTLTPEEKRVVLSGMKRVSSGLRSSMPITCYGDKCPFKLQCPLHQIGKAPVGKSCPIESMLLDLYTKRYIDEFEVDPEYLSEVTTMNMLAATHVMEMRAFILLGKDEAENPDGLIKNVVGFNNDEEPIVQLQEHPAFAIIDRAWRWRKNLLESLVGTRKEKYKRDAVSGGISASSISSAAADMRSTIEKLTIVDITGDD
jgi:hypothetical protein